MDLNISQVGSLVGAQKTVQSTVYDVVTKTNLQGIDASLRTQSLGDISTTLTDSQESSLSSLESYIGENVNAADQAELLESLSALRGLLELNSTSSAKLDPIFSLITSSEGLTETFSLARLLDVEA